MSAAVRNCTSLAATFQPPKTNQETRNREEAQVLTLFLPSNTGPILAATMVQSLAAANIFSNDCIMQPLVSEV